MKSGFVTLVGRPNVGKSTLLNSIIGKKVAITSNKPQTTRNAIQGIYTSEDTHIVFIDTPGIHKPKSKLGEYLNKQAYYSINDVDIVLMLVDASDSIGPGDKFVMEKLREAGKPVILIINKIDKIDKQEGLIKKIVEYNELFEFDEIIPTSALKKDNIKEVIKTLEKYLPDSVKFYDDETLTNRPLSFLISEVVREKVFNLTNEEIPHSTTCILEKMEKNNDSYVINVCIVVDRENLKKIIIGKQGSMIKEIGIRARKELEELLDSKVYLETYVKVIKNWRDKEKYLSEFGYKDFE